MSALRLLTSPFSSLSGFSDRVEATKTLVRWTFLVSAVAVAVGSACALFLWLLDRATELRFQFPWLLFLLPIAGFLIGLAYLWKGSSTEGGNNLIVEQIHEPGAGVPLRMAPFILVATVLTHLFGGSAGREGTAVQLGGSLASGVGKLFKLDSDGVRIILMAGIAAGFGAVFGTPLAGAVFALEVLTLGRVQYVALIPCLASALIADITCRAWGIHHTLYNISYLSGQSHVEFDPIMLLKVAIAGVAFGLIGMVFAEANHTLGAFMKKHIKFAPLRPLVGGLAIIALVYIFGTREYLGLGVWSPNPHDVTIARLFGPEIHPWAWALKLLFTVVTLSAGFKGGEVTPLFFIGAALGNALAGILGVPPDLFAALGFVAVFAGAANTPLACTLMGIELFGSTHGVYIAVACCVAYLCSGHSGIYLSQRIGVPKTLDGDLPPDATLRDARQMRAQPALATIATNLIEKVAPASSTSASTFVQKESESMSHHHAVTSREIGLVRIYLKPNDRSPQATKSWWNQTPLYRELVKAAKADGIMNATAHHTHFGYANHGSVHAEGAELANPELTMYVELICARPKLEQFCAKHAALLAKKVIVYKHLEHWTLAPHVVDSDNSTPQARAAFTTV
mgnify:CR=1 FL=1